MKKIFLLFTITFIIYTTNCSLLPEDSKPNYCIFTVTTNGTKKVFEWQGLYYIGFNETLGHYTNIFVSAIAFEEEDTFHDYIFIRIPDSTVGYSSSNGLFDNIAYYDTLGNSYIVYSTMDETFSDVYITEWSEDSVSGSFNAFLYNHTIGQYAVVCGAFKSYYSSESSRRTSSGVKTFKENVDKMDKQFKSIEKM